MVTDDRLSVDAMPPIDVTIADVNVPMPICDDLTPPQITSTLNKGKSVIKPIAFKPISHRFSDNNQRYGSTPALARPSSQMAHYGSSNDLLHRRGKSNAIIMERKLRSVSPLAMSSLPLSANHKLRIGYDSMDNIRKTPPSYSLKDCSTLSKSSFRTIERASASEGSGSLLDLTPSPCDSSSLAEMEAALRERDYELTYLRKTMEHNEQVIFKVYQEKEHAYERELRKLKALQDNRLRAAAQKSLKLEQMLMMQTYQLQEEKKRLREENVEAVSEISALREEIATLRMRLEETEWTLCQKSGELAHIKSQLKDTQGEQTNKGHEVLTLKKEIRQLRSEMQDKESEMTTLRKQLSSELSTAESISAPSEASYLLEEIDDQMAKLGIENQTTRSECNDAGQEGERTEEVVEEEASTYSKSFLEKLKTKIDCLIDKWKQERLSWEKERNTWANEKEKVLCYQKQLQLSYIEMFRRNRTLEAEIENLSLGYDLTSKSNGKKQLSSMSQSAIPL